ncbi:hypothetical protein MTsPCn5_35730 [Croceitalea sp. MTPC5]|uniref:hypothetical protein n=1 Tax=Croceitalea sp. MTPC5 TaxID=3056565 RepID=UPI002B3714AE|nr:hypothetical protein MTsPCn5_35730 [Croceitalea sp. MTPC5]
MKKILILSFLISGIAIAQNDDGSEQENFYEGLVSKMVNIPNSPEAQAFAKYGDTEVSLYSGVPQINIPLHSVQGREMNLPISLTYDASGIKVEQIATPMGLGWNLQVGGRISRMVNGLPDDYDSGTYGTIYNNNSPQGLSIKNQVLDYSANQDRDSNNTFSSLQAGQDYYEFLLLANNNHIDPQPDYYSLNVPGISETLVIDYTDNNTPKALNNPRIKITRSTTGLNQSITGWTVTNEDGTVFNFNTSEKTFRQNLKADGSTSGAGGSVIGQGDANTTYNSSWLLSSITSANGKDHYVFNYNNLGYWSQEEGFSSAGVSNMIVSNNNPNHNYPYPETTGTNVVYKVQQQLLGSIQHNGKIVVSMEHGNRDDLNFDQGTNSKYTAMNVFDFQGGQVANPSTLKRIEFDNATYFNSDDWANYKDIRLKLDGITIKGNDGDISYETYRFEYERPNDLPSRDCTGQDYWGYYNGKCGQNFYEAYSTSGISFPGGDRNPNSYHARTGILNKIIYPTKGYTIFTFEGHKDQNNDIGGIRIQNITDYANTGLPASIKKYSYSNPKKNERKLSEVKTIDNLSTQLIRYTSIPKGSEPYVTYGKVNERRIDNIGQNNGITTYEFYTGNKGIISNLSPPFANRFTGNIEVGMPFQQIQTDSNGNLVKKDSTIYYKAQQVLNVPGYVVYVKEKFQNKRLFLTQIGNIARADVADENDMNPCFQNVNNANCPYDVRLSANNNALRGKKTQALGQYGGVRKIVTIQALPKANGTSQTVTTTQDIIFTSQDDGQGNIDPTDKLYLPRKIRTTSSKGEVFETLKYYPSDNVVLGSSELEDYNNLIEEVKIVNTKDPGTVNERTISITENEYGTAGAVMMPTLVKTKKDNVTIDNRAEFTYYANGNLKTSKQTNGPTTVYLWGYDQRYPVAKIENSSVAAIEALSSFTSGFDLGSSGLSDEQEADLRSLAETLVTIYDYKPLVGVKSITDHRGFKTQFEYDDFNRLEAVKDEEGNLLKDYDYGYATPIQN